MKIRDFEIGAGRTFIIAETCSNIIGHLDRLETIVRDVAWTGAQGLKIQLFRGDHFGEKEAESKRRLEFPRDRFPELVELCHKHGLACGASVFDEDAVDLVVKYGDFLKLATRERSNEKLYYQCVNSDLPVVASYKYGDGEGKQTNPRVLMMACIPEYPTERVSIPHTLPGYDEPGRYWGWSSHTSHWLDVSIAVSRGAVAIEKHIAFHVNDPEWGWSLDVDAFKQMCKDVAWVEGVR